MTDTGFGRLALEVACPRESAASTLDSGAARFRTPEFVTVGTAPRSCGTSKLLALAASFTGATGRLKSAEIFRQ